MHFILTVCIIKPSFNSNIYFFQNLEKFVNDAPNGVIYFSMGSLIKAHSFPEERRAAFLNVFSKIKQRVLWKWENDSIPNQPPNVMIQKWMPQFDILCNYILTIKYIHTYLLDTRGEIL